MVCFLGFESLARNRKFRRLLQLTRREVIGPRIQPRQRRQRRGDQFKIDVKNTWLFGLRDREKIGFLGELNGWTAWGSW